MIDLYIIIYEAKKQWLWFYPNNLFLQLLVRLPPPAFSQFKSSDFSPSFKEEIIDRQHMIYSAGPRALLLNAARGSSNHFSILFNKPLYMTHKSLLLILVTHKSSITSRWIPENPLWHILIAMSIVVYIICTIENNYEPELPNFGDRKSSAAISLSSNNAPFACPTGATILGRTAH